MLCQVRGELSVEHVDILCLRLYKVQNRVVTVVRLDILFGNDIVVAGDQS